jgi:hypothetical protein
MHTPAKLKRPISVWIAQILLLLVASFVLLFQLVVVINIPKSAGSATEYLEFMVLFVVIPTIAFVGMALRKSWGRWLGVGFLSLLLLFTGLAQMTEGSGPIMRDEYATGIILLALFLSLILRLVFAKNVSRFFSKNPNRSNSSDAQIGAFP